MSSKKSPVRLLDLSCSPYQIRYRESIDDRGDLRCSILVIMDRPDYLPMLDGSALQRVPLVYEDAQVLCGEYYRNDGVGIVDSTRRLMARKLGDMLFALMNGKNLEEDK